MLTGRWLCCDSLSPLHLERFPFLQAVFSLLLGLRAVLVAVDAKEFVFLVWKAQIADPRLPASAPRARVDNGIPDASVAHPACFTLVQQLDLPSGVELAHLGHRSTVLLAGLGSLWEAQLPIGLEEVDFA